MSIDLRVDQLPFVFPPTWDGIGHDARPAGRRVEAKMRWEVGEFNQRKTICQITSHAKGVVPLSIETSVEQVFDKSTKTKFNLTWESTIFRIHLEYITLRIIYIYTHTYICVMLCISSPVPTNHMQVSLQLLWVIMVRRCYKCIYSKRVEGTA